MYIPFAASLYLSARAQFTEDNCHAYLSYASWRKPDVFEKCQFSGIKSLQKQKLSDRRLLEEISDQNFWLGKNFLQQKNLKKIFVHFLEHLSFKCLKSFFE